jgi:hypothetical protein
VVDWSRRFRRSRDISTALGPSRSRGVRRRRRRRSLSTALGHGRNRGVVDWSGGLRRSVVYCTALGPGRTSRIGRWSGSLRSGGLGSRCTVARARALSATAQFDFDTLILAFHGGRVEIVLVVAGWTSVELVVTIVLELTIASNGKTSCWRSSDVALELGSWRRQNTASTLSIGNTAVAIDAVRSSRIATANSVLPIRKLTESAAHAARGSE